MTQRSIVVAGASGDLGGRILAHLLQQGAAVRALVRTQTSWADRQRLTEMGATLAPVDLDDVASVAEACHGASCVVSALSGTREVIVDRQTVLLDAAVRAGVPRFVPSDYSADFTRTSPGHNRNFDLRREFMGRLDRAPIQATSVLVGAFLDMLGAEMPIIRPRLRRVLYVGDVDQLLDFTSRADTAAFTARVALDDTAPRILRVAGDTLTVRDLADVLTEATGNRFRPLRAGTLSALSGLASLVRAATPNSTAAFPAWQGMAYLRDQFSGQAQLGDAEALANDRYPDLTWTSVRQAFVRDHQPLHP